MLQLMRYLKPYGFTIVAIIILILLQSLADLYLPTLMSDIVNNGIISGDTGYIWKMGGFMLAVSVVGTIVSILASLYASKVSSAFGKVVRHKVFSKVESFSTQEFDKLGTASLITRTTNDINQVQQVVLMILRMMVMAPLMCIGGIIMALYKDVKLSMVLLVVVPILAIAILAIVRIAMPYFKMMQKKLDRINLVLREGLTGIRVIRAFNRTSYEEGRFTESNKDLMDTAVKVNQIMAFMMPLMMLIMNICVIAIVWFGSHRIDANDMMIGDLMAFIQYAMQIMFSLLMMSMMLVMIPRAQASAVRINEVLDMEASVKDEPAFKQAAAKPGFEATEAVIAFDQVSYTYPGAEKPAVENLSFTCKQGEVTAIIGGTGSGKSTVIQLIERFFDSNQGEIRFKGVNVKDWSLDELRGNIALVPQKTTIFSGTVAENIRYGKEDASDEEVREAAAIAQALPFIERMEQGFDTMLAQGGTNISGGQKQRLSIARALVRKPSLYLFDDSFSALDYKTDAALRAALKTHVHDAAMIIVAQRVSTVMHAEQIIVMDEGVIVGKGTHHELLQSCEVYREIVQSQLSEEESA
ncbi:multidrug ABC transporter ATP-binding protein [Paenibacillus montaniterrae]|uniref:Multidrug ABC transporter ATP-binding protein n=1 Tax=Paenibacillus montaniterrae TaxID=429341 RepID=A0A920CTU1_9BACL|nr:ABC transporter ATP-binding protein [Paenibacillus montaniterrae]GIP16297.1 multidrug ABC transporter ATP-binding protein [Paenibacillus montaniterrae]